MKASEIKEEWPNSLRWFLVQNLQSFVPWHLMSSSDEFEFAAKAFEKEDIHKGKVFVFASRQDNDDFAGLEVVDRKVTEKVIVFHPVFSIGADENQWNIVNSTYADVFEFFQKQVVPDMKEWALTEDASDLIDGV